MPKMKTNRSAAKRFSLTGTGKLKRRKAYKSHLNVNKNRKRLRRLGQSALVHESDAPTIRKMING